MNIELLIFIISVFSTFFVLSILWYAQFSAYPQFKWIPEQDFIGVHKKYVNNLWLSTYGPIIVNIISVGLLIFFLPAHIPIIFAIVLNFFNLLGIIFTFGLAVPVHIRMDREERYTMKDLDHLLLYNALRLGCVIINSALLLYLLGTALASGVRFA